MKNDETNAATSVASGTHYRVDEDGEVQLPPQWAFCRISTLTALVLEKRLLEGWEPFAVVSDPAHAHEVIVYLKFRRR